jgi:hypothetical protein
MTNQTKSPSTSSWARPVPVKALRPPPWLALGLPHLSGDMFRRAVERADELGQTVRAYMKRGRWCPTPSPPAWCWPNLTAAARASSWTAFRATWPRPRAWTRRLPARAKRGQRHLYQGRRRRCSSALQPLAVQEM